MKQIPRSSGLKPSSQTVRGDYPEIALLIDTSGEWGRGIIRGVADYARHFGPWRFSIGSPKSPRGQEILEEWDGEGVIGRFGRSEQEFCKAHRLKCPVVDVAGNSSGPSRFPRVATDFELAGRLAAEHLLDRGLRHFGALMYNLPNAFYNGFYMRLHDAGLESEVFQFEPASSHRGVWKEQVSRLVAWLQRLPKPVGLITDNDLDGRMLIQSCIRVGICVPEDAAILSRGNDELLCELCDPPLTSIALAVERQGYEAAALLDRMKRGEDVSSTPRYIEPLCVVARHSTDSMAITDPEIAAAIRFIRDRHEEPITVTDVLATIPTSRRSLERRFLQTLGRTPAAEIRRVRIEKAKYLLRETDMQMPAVAAASGFSTHIYLSAAFRRDTGMTPRTYRLQNRSR